MKPSLKLIFIGLSMLISMACWNPFERNADRVNVGPDAWSSLVVYFKVGTTEAQVESFNHNVLSELRSDGRGENFRGGIASYLRLTPDQGNGHWGFAITFYKKATEEQRKATEESITSNELVYKVFENIAPKDIKESDLK